MDSLQEQRELVALSSRILGKLCLTKSTSGHVSVRVPDTDTFFIRAPGPSVEEATITAIKLNDLVEMNYRATLLGTPHSIPDEEIAIITDETHARQRHGIVVALLRHAGGRGGRGLRIEFMDQHSERSRFS